MKSKSEDLKKRGFVVKDEEKVFHTYNKEQLFDMLNSNNAFNRTASIIALRKKCCLENEEYTRLLLKRLSIETSLYTKIEICNSLKMGNEPTANIMCEYLGKIADNQHKTVPDSVSKKKSYPLPRDIIARTLGKMDQSIINILIQHLYMDERDKISELIDAIGFIVFYNVELATTVHFNSIKNTYERFFTDDLIVWKIAVCCSSFPSKESINLINHIKETITNQTIILELDRSHKLINYKSGISI